MRMRFSLVILLYFIGYGTLFSQLVVNEVTNLPTVLNETSGLIHLNGVLVTHNDSGNSPELFEINPETGTIIRTVRVDNAANVDWEDLAQDAEFIYIGDFGNNSGNRRDLAIYKVDKREYLTRDVVTASRISFVYEDQTDFTPTQNSDWDAEALVAIGDFLYVFTKQWQSLGTTVYRIPKSESTVSAVNVETYNVNGLVTGAEFNEDLSQLILVGYSSFLLPFILTVEDAPNVPPFFSDAQKEELEILPLQVEAIASDGQRYYFTSEEFINETFGITSLARLFFFEVTLPEVNQNGSEDEMLILFTERNSNALGYEIRTDETIFGVSIFDSAGKELITDSEVPSNSGEIDISILASGIYHVRFILSGADISKSFVKF